MVTAPALHSGHEVVGGTVGTTLTVCSYCLRLLKLHWRTSAVVFLAARAMGGAG